MVPPRAAYPCPAARYTRHIGIIPYLGALAYHEIVNILPMEGGGLRMIYFTGDMHGDRGRFNAWKLRWLGEKDALVVCGDFGFLWNGSPEEEEILQWIGKRRYQVLFLEGTHDNLDLLERYPVEEWNGGLTHRITGNLRHLIRGQIFSIQGKSLLALGGGESRDAAFRRAGENWWPQELPAYEELPDWSRRLEEAGGQVDYIASHQAPTNVDSCITGTVCEVTALTAFMDQLQQKYRFGRWFFGSYHQNRIVPPKYCCLFDKVVPGEPKKKRRKKG